jgi:hypothetical protein
MKTKLVVRYVSGREEQVEMELFGGGVSGENRLNEFVKDPTIVLHAEKEVIIIPATAIECITVSLPDPPNQAFTFPNVRKGRRLK